MQSHGQPEGEAVLDDHIYALTPQGRVVELPRGSTPVDFAYAVHTQLGHRTKGAKVDGVLVPLNTKLETGQTVEIIAAKVGQPSRDWLSAEKALPQVPAPATRFASGSMRSRPRELTAQGREKIDKELARLGKTAVKLEDLAKRLGYEGVDEALSCLRQGGDHPDGARHRSAAAQVRRAPSPTRFRSVSPAIRARATCSSWGLIRCSHSSRDAATPCLPMKSWATSPEGEA